MADYRDRLEEWREMARRKARDLDEKYGIRERVEEGARIAQDAARRGLETISEGAERARSEAERLTGEFREQAERIDDEYEVRERARRAAEDAARLAREAGDAFRAAGRTAGEKAGEVFDEARGVYERASQFYDAGARFTRATAAATGALFKARNWARENPGQAVLVSLSLITGVRAGAAFPGLDAVFLGSHPHWFTHSALPVYALRRAGQKFDDYLRERERLIARGELSKAERERAEFERKIVKCVGAPLLGAFSCAAGVTMWVQIFQPGRITGAPISWLLGGNPLLDGIWLFANGVICIHQGYQFFAMALKKEDLERVHTALKGLIPAPSNP
jgi:hypothetical protein